MPFITQKVINGRELTIFPIILAAPLSVSGSSRQNAIRVNVGKHLENLELVQLETLQEEVTNLVLIDPDWPICVALCDSNNIATISASELLQSVQGEIRFLMDMSETFPALTPAPAPKPEPKPTVPKSGDTTKLLWGGAAILALLLLG